MVFRAFLAARPGPVLALLALGLGVGALEGAFVFLVKSAMVSGPLPWSWTRLLAAAFAVVLLRCLLQGLSARLETSAVATWLGARREALLRLAAGRAFPAYRDPWRGALTACLDQGLRDLAEGAAAGLRCFSAAVQALVLAPLLLAFGWRPALAALLLALPVVLLGRLRAARLAALADRQARTGAGLAAEAGAFAEGLEALAGNGRMDAGAAALSEAGARHGRATEAWEKSKAMYPPLLEAVFFAALAALLALAARAGGGAPWTASLLPFAALLLLLYRPLREWARAYPARLPGDRAFAAWRNLEVSLEARPRRAPPEAAPGTDIRLESVAFAYPGPGGPRKVFADLTLSLDPAAFTWVPGPNGAGKTTLLRLLGGIEAPDAGRLLLPDSMRVRPFAYLPQRALVEPDWPAWAAGFASRRPADWEALAEILGLLPLVARAPAAADGVAGGMADGLEARRAATAWAAGLSGGQRQRLALARVFASDAACLLLDEPTTGLAAGDRERIMGGLLAFRGRKPGRGAVLVSHEPFLGEFCSRTLRLEDVTQAIRVKEGRA